MYEVSKDPAISAFAGTGSSCVCRPVRPGADVCQVPWAVRGLVPGTSYSFSGGECTDAGNVISRP